jgi:hypothetical protein
VKHPRQAMHRHRQIPERKIFTHPSTISRKVRDRQSWTRNSLEGPQCGHASQYRTGWPASTHRVWALTSSSRDMILKHRCLFWGGRAAERPLRTAPSSFPKKNFHLPQRAKRRGGVLFFNFLGRGHKRPGLPRRRGPVSPTLTLLSQFPTQKIRGASGK